MHQPVAGADQRPTLDPTHHIIAVIVAALEQTPEAIADEHKQRFLVELAAFWPPVRSALADLVLTEDRLDAARSADSCALDGEEALASCHLYAVLDDLLAMAEASGFADPGELLDPDGSRQPLLDHLAVLAALRAEQVHPQCTPRVLRWLCRWAEREAREERFRLRQQARAARWPFSATGAMGCLGCLRFPMRYGHLQPLERRFRAVMVKARGDCEAGDVAAAAQGLETFAQVAGAMPQRMRGLVRAGIAHTFVRALDRPPATGALGGLGREAVSQLIAEAESLLCPMGRGAREDNEGLRLLREKLAALGETRASRQRSSR